MKIANRNVESTPSTILVLTHKGKVIHELRQHWTEKAGLYGYQIVSQMWVTDRNGKEEYSENATSGCGYCKESNSLDNFARSVMGRVPGPLTSYNLRPLAFPAITRIYHRYGQP